MDSIEKKLDNFLNNEAVPSPGPFSLSSIAEIMKHAGNPHLVFKSIHIAGTNGKGSVAGFLSNIFLDAGYKTGKFTSPHLNEINERIQVNNICINNTAFHRYLDTIIGIAEQNNIVPTYFDILTAAAFMYFSDENCEIAIIETGLGGRLDSTNIIIPLVSIITSISMDHVNVLGPDLASIAVEKAGIIKAGVPVISAQQDREVEIILKNHAEGKSALFLESGMDFSFSLNNENAGEIDFIYHFKRSDILLQSTVSSPVREQVENASIALTASLLVQEYFPRLTPAVLESGIKNTILGGRFQVISARPLVIFDPAHNRKAVESLFRTINSAYPERDVISIITVMKDKEVDVLINLILKNSTRVIYFSLDDARCYIPGRAHENMVIVKNLNQLADIIKPALSDKSLVVATGSFRIFNHAELLSRELSTTWDDA